MRRMQRSLFRNRLPDYVVLHHVARTVRALHGYPVTHSYSLAGRIDVIRRAILVNDQSSAILERDAVRQVRSWRLRCLGRPVRLFVVSPLGGSVGREAKRYQRRAQQNSLLSFHGSMWFHGSKCPVEVEVENPAATVPGPPPRSWQHQEKQADRLVDVPRMRCPSTSG